MGIDILYQQQASKSEYALQILDKIEMRTRVLPITEGKSFL